MYLSLTFVILGAYGGVTAFVFSQHVAAPHVDAITVRQYDELKSFQSDLNSRVVRRLDRIEDKLDEIRDKGAAVRIDLLEERQRNTPPPRRTP